MTQPPSQGSPVCSITPPFHHNFPDSTLPSYDLAQLNLVPSFPLYCQQCSPFVLSSRSFFSLHVLHMCTSLAAQFKCSLPEAIPVSIQLHYLAFIMCSSLIALLFASLPCVYLLHAYLCNADLEGKSCAWFDLSLAAVDSSVSSPLSQDVCVVQSLNKGPLLWGRPGPGWPCHASVYVYRDLQNPLWSWLS